MFELLMGETEVKLVLPKDVCQTLYSIPRDYIQLGLTSLVFSGDTGDLHDLFGEDDQPSLDPLPEEEG